MEGPKTKRPSGSREMTYRVGWKKGKLKIGENGKVTSAESTVIFLEQSLWLRFVDRVLWRPLPIPSASALSVLLWGLPIVGFGLIWWLVYRLAGLF